MKLSNAFSTGLTLSISLFISACAVTDADKIADAQICLDKSTQATAQACLTKIEGISSKSASLIRCSANFITEGIAEGTRLSDAMGNLSGNGNSTLAMMSALAFTSQDTSTANEEFAAETYSHCADAGNPGFVLIASFSNMATTVAAASVGAFSDGNITEAEMISGLAGASDATLGATAVVAYSTSCQAGQESNIELCTQLGAAIAGGASNEDIGAALKDAWN